MKQQIRISMTDDVKQALFYLQQHKYPILSYPEIIRVVLSKEIASTKTNLLKKFGTEPTSDELMVLAEDAFYVHDKDEVEYRIEDTKKPFSY